jgi:hypothetical protein
MRRQKSGRNEKWPLAVFTNSSDIVKQGLPAVTSIFRRCSRKKSFDSPSAGALSVSDK